MAHHKCRPYWGGGLRDESLGQKISLWGEGTEGLDGRRIIPGAIPRMQRLLTRAMEPIPASPLSINQGNVNLKTSGAGANKGSFGNITKHNSV